MMLGTGLRQTVYRATFTLRQILQCVGSKMRFCTAAGCVRMGKCGTGRKSLPAKEAGLSFSSKK